MGYTKSWALRCLYYQYINWDICTIIHIYIYIFWLNQNISLYKLKWEIVLPANHRSSEGIQRGHDEIYTPRWIVLWDNFWELILEKKQMICKVDFYGYGVSTTGLNCCNTFFALQESFGHKNSSCLKTPWQEDKHWMRVAFEDMAHPSKPTTPNS